MVDFAAMALVAKRLIDANGRLVTLIQQGDDAVPDSTKPWRSDGTYARNKAVGSGVFTKLKTENPDNTKRKRQMLLFAAADDLGLRLEEFDQVEDGEVLWKIVDVDVVGPADDRVLYKFEVER